MHLWGQLEQLLEECLPLLPPWSWPSWLGPQHLLSLSVGREALEEKADPQRPSCWPARRQRLGRTLGVEEWLPLESLVLQE